MANNNKIKKLVSKPEADTMGSAEPDLDSVATIDDQELETDADTFQFNHLEVVESDHAEPATLAGADPGPGARTEHIDRLQFDIEQLRTRWTGLHKELEEREELTENVNRDLAEAKRTVASLEKDNLELIKRLKAAEQQARDADEKRVQFERQQRPGDSLEIRDLRNQIIRTESYADTLRMKLSAEIASSKNAKETERKLEDAAMNATNQLDGLREQMEKERDLNGELKQQVDDLVEAHERELRQVRFELGSAQDTITDHLTINEQLTSDLIDNQGFRQALEDQLSTTARQSEVTIRELNGRLKKLRRANDDLERKLSTKDNAIAALLNELANPARTERKGNNEHVVQNQAAVEETPNVGTDEASASSRVTRLLIGEVDGQELRFPLFKDRLTIGRTSHNDIQVKTEYVSRRHAVIASDSGVTRIVDWGSKNGVLVNNERVNEQYLNSGDVVTIGTTNFRYAERIKR